MKVFAKDVMQKEVKSVRSDLSLSELETSFVDENVSGFPVVDSGAILGVVSASDVLARICEERRDAKSPTSFYEDHANMEFTDHADDWQSSKVGEQSEHLCVRDVMNPDVISVPPDMPLQEVAAVMTDQAIHRVLVVENNELVGLISSLDIVRACGRTDIEISFVAPEILDF